MQKSEERQKQILELISSNGTMKVTELASYFDVSRETIRRDLIVLNEAGSLQKGFGWAIPIYNFETTPIANRMKENDQAKKLIAQEALKLINSCSVIYLDTGSTIVYLARLLKQKTDLTIITNSIPVVDVLAGTKNQLIIAGGTVNQKVMSTLGAQAASFLSNIKVDIAFLASSGFEGHKGPTSNTFEDCEIKKTIIKNAKMRVVLADSSKSSYSSLTQYANWQDIDYLVTNKKINIKTNVKVGN